MMLLQYVVCNKNQNANYRKKALALGVKEDKFFQLRMNHFA